MIQQNNNIRLLKSWTSRRIGKRIRANGIVALTDCGKAIVTRICDIGSRGMSFSHADELSIAGNELKMDVLIFDVQSDDELFISHLKGRVRSKVLVSDPDGGAPIWRFYVEFLHLEARHRQTLKDCLGLPIERVSSPPTLARKVA